MKLIYSLALSLPLLSATALAQEPQEPLKIGDQVVQHFKVPPKDGEYRKDWSPLIGNIGCARDNTTPDEMYCLKLGALQVGMEFYRLVILSNRHEVPADVRNIRLISQSADGDRTVLIPIETFQVSGGQLQMRSYLVAIDNAGKINKLQLTGKPSKMTDNLAFSSIKLGSSKQWVIDILGLPSSVTDVPQIKGTLWNYWPFPFSIEFVDEIVYSIEIHAPTNEDRDKPFVPLSSVQN